ncbi:MAG TPA: VWA domain-containing protein [Steroidobacteraceae bacterium]|nr:VWA domain-containing protein [Steroidobacteraceae bacterium]
MLVPLTLQASIPPDRDEELDEVVVTGAMRVGQGGAQDINYFRGEVAFERIPHPDDFTAEGLLSEHDIVLPAEQTCRQLFCLTGDAVKADLLAVPQARYLVGVGFATNIDARKWHRDPVNLVAVVDKSGSMDGEPLELVRQSLVEVARQLHDGDQMTIVLYGDRAHVHLDTTKADRGGVSRIVSSIGAIRSNGSTSMEAGLRLGYSIADATAPAFKGRTRLMLFTDERPNVDATDAASFMGMATSASRAGIGLTTIGVGVQFGAGLATRISSVRGGNLYFIRDTADVQSLFANQLDYMVSELAHDLSISITPRPGLKIGGVYGIPGELLGWQDQSTVRVTIPTVFLDNHGGGIFFTLMPEGAATFLPERHDNAALADVAVSYQPLKAAASPESHTIAVALGDGGPSPGMLLGHALIDEFTVLHEATSAHYLRNDQETAYQLLAGFRDRLAQTTLPDMDQEKQLIDSLHARIAFLSGHGGEVPEGEVPPFVKLWGRWTVTRATGGVDLKRGDTLEFTSENDLLTWDAKGGDDPREEESYESNEKQIYLADSDLTFYYQIKGDVMNLHHRKANVWVRLRREPAP